MRKRLTAFLLFTLAMPGLAAGQTAIDLPEPPAFQSAPIWQSIQSRKVVRPFLGLAR